jgi:hypothetical protein
MADVAEFVRNYCETADGLSFSSVTEGIGVYNVYVSHSATVPNVNASNLLDALRKQYDPATTMDISRPAGNETSKFIFKVPMPRLVSKSHGRSASSYRNKDASFERVVVNFLGAVASAGLFYLVAVAL